MKRFEPHDYQSFALRWLIDRTLMRGHGGGAFFLDPGLGKTATTLAYVRLLRQLGLAAKVLVVAPLRVVYSVWRQECEQWSQFAGLRCSIVHGTPTQREAALACPADIYLTNCESVPWLQGRLAGRPFPFELLVVDESTKFKTWGNVRTKALRKLAPQFRYRLILTGTPSPNSLEDLFSQVWLCDLGETFGGSITRFRSRYFQQGGFKGYEWILRDGSPRAIEERIVPLCLRLAAADHLDLPELLTHDVWVDLPEDVRRAYKKLEREFLFELAGSDSLNPLNAGAKYLLCKQIAGGGVYDAGGEPQHVHDAKLDAAADLVDELQGKPALLVYQFRHELGRLRKLWPKLPAINGQTSGGEADDLIRRWNAGELPLLAVQPQSLSHGINMQAGPGRDIVWLGLTDSLEIYQQLNARIYRQGVSGQVRIHRVLARGTVDLAIADRIDRKEQSQTAMLDALKRYREGTLA